MNLSFFRGIQKAADQYALDYSFLELLILLGHSFIIGIILVVITYYSSTTLLNPKKNLKNQKIKLLLGSSNILFLCLGLTTVMLLVNNNLARAFSIGAAIALVRFRIKLGAKGAAANILFGIIAGIACGLNEIELAWLITGMYLIISLGLFILTKQKTPNTVLDFDEET